MQNITIGRFEQDPQAQGVIRPQDGRWQLVLDKDGYPHLYLQVNVKDDEGNSTKGMLALDDLIPKPMTIRDIMDGGEFGGKLAPEEEEAAYQEFLADREKNPVPCPRDA